MQNNEIFNYEQTSLDLIPCDAAVNQTKTIQVANEFITAKYDLNIVPIKLLYTIISSFKQTNEENKFYLYRFNIKELAKAIGIYDEKRKNQKEIIKLLRDIRTTQILIIDRYDQNINLCEWTEANFFSSVKYMGDGTVQITIDPIMHKYFFNLKNRFTLLEIKEILSLNSSYSIKLYQSLKQYINFGRRIFSIESLREILMRQNKYNKYVDFHRYVIKPAVEAINKHTSLNVTYTTNGGRGIGKVTEITFRIGEKDFVYNIEKLNKIEKSLYDRVIFLGISQKTAYNLIQNNSPVVIDRNLTYVSKTTTPKKNINAFITSAIKKDYAKYVVDRNDKKKEIESFFVDEIEQNSEHELSPEWEKRLEKIQSIT